MGLAFPRSAQRPLDFLSAISGKFFRVNAWVEARALEKIF